MRWLKQHWEQTFSLRADLKISRNSYFNDCFVYGDIMKRNIKNTELFIGIGNGREIISKIKNAKEKIKIISPYIGSSQIYELVNAKNRGVDVSLITTDDLSNSYVSVRNIMLKVIDEDLFINTELLKKKRFIIFLSKGNLYNYYYNQSTKER